MNLYEKINALFYNKPNLQGVAMTLSTSEVSIIESVASKLLSVSTVESIMSHFITSIINEISAHCAKISAMNLQADVTPAELDAAYKKLLGLINVLAPVMNIIATDFPAMLPIVKMAESYAAVS